MNRKKIISILFVLLMLTVFTSEVFASETTRTLKFGSRGNDVVKLQQELKNKGYYNYSIDGVYGKITERAVINFQIDAKIRIDGIAGPQTQSKLFGVSTMSSRGTAYGRNFNSDDIYWLTRIIQAEAGGEPYNGKVAVGNVVLNRVISKAFPNSVYGVIFEYYGSIPQFSPVADGTIYNTPSQQSLQAAKDAVNGVRPVGDATYFFNPSKASGSWIVNNKSYVTRIGGHVFYR